jgi:SAM-dependent methyltransferase
VSAVVSSAPEFPNAVWTSFDRYSRYAAIVRAVRASLGDGPLRVLDVGDPSGYLTIFDDAVTAVCVDLTVDASALPGARRLVGDGTRLPFPSQSFDAVVSSDALEHVPDDLRAAFLSELARVTRDVVVVAAPFATEGVAGAEALARNYVLHTTGELQDQLEEHHERGLPDVDAAANALRGCGLSVGVEGNGNLHDWLLLMMLKHQLMARPALDPLSPGFDLAYNHTMAARNEAPPFYRHVICARRNGEPAFGTPPSHPRIDDATAASVLNAWLTSATAELSRQDTATEASNVHKRLEITEERLSRLETVVADLVPQLEHLSNEVADLRPIIEATHALIRHPLKSVVGKVQRRAD